MTVHNFPSPPVEADALKIEDVIAALGALVRLYDNPDTPTEDAAVDAAQEGRPAYWTTAKYHNQVARLLVEEANQAPHFDDEQQRQRGGLRNALQKWADDRSPIHARRTIPLLGQLIPLNAAAISEFADLQASAAMNIAIRTAAAVRPTSVVAE